MKLSNGLSALIGIILIAAPWWVNTAIDRYAIITAALIGILQLFGSLLVRSKSGWRSWPGWLSLACGTATIVYPLVFHFDFLLFFVFACIGYATVLINFSIMNKQ